MTILRGPTDADHFTILPNRIIRDQRLSFRARGVLAYLLSMPPGWRTSSTRVARETREGRDAIRTALDELRAEGVRHPRPPPRRSRPMGHRMGHHRPLCTTCGQRPLSEA